MTPARFETHRPFLLAGLRRWYAFADGPIEIPNDWKRFVARLPLPGQIGDVTYGATCQADIPGARFEYMASVEVRDFNGLRPDVGRMRVPEAHYAIFVHEGPTSGIRDTIMGAHRWLATNGEWKDGGTPNFERYGPGYDPATEAGDTEIWLPVAMLQIEG